MVREVGPKHHQPVPPKARKEVNRNLVVTAELTGGAVNIHDAGRVGKPLNGKRVSKTPKTTLKVVERVFKERAYKHRTH